MIREKLLKKDYVVKDKIKSLIDPSKDVVTEEYVICPFCKQKIPETVGKTDTFICCKCACGLYMVICGDVIDCQLDEKKLRLTKLKKLNENR